MAGNGWDCLLGKTVLVKWWCSLMLFGLEREPCEFRQRTAKSRNVSNVSEWKCFFGYIKCHDHSVMELNLLWPAVEIILIRLENLEVGTIAISVSLAFHMLIKLVCYFCNIVQKFQLLLPRANDKSSMCIAHYPTSYHQSSLIEDIPPPSTIWELEKFSL